MVVSDRRTYGSLEWDAYCKLEGVSFSSIKAFKGEATEGMKIGTYVHNFISEPDKYNGEEAAIVVPLARAIITELGTSAKFGKAEVCMTAEYEHDGMVMIHKSRIDRLYMNLVIDFKVIAGSLKNYIQHLNYDEQIRGYMNDAGVNDGLIISINRKTRQIEKALIKQDCYWWQRKVHEYGRVKV